MKLCTTPQSDRQNCLLAEWSEEAGPFAPIFLPIAESKISIDSFQPTYQFVLMGSIKVALELLLDFLMIRILKSHRILIPDVPPPTRRQPDQDLVIAGIGIFCATVVIGAVLFVFLGA